MPADADDWGGFVKLYVASLRRDQPVVYNDHRLFWWYVRLLEGAYRHWPEAAPWPRATPEDVMVGLVASGLIDDEGGEYYRAHGLDRMRARERGRGYAGGLARARAGVRDQSTGRWYSDAGETVARNAGADAGQTNGDAGPATLAPTVVHDAGAPTLAPASPAPANQRIDKRIEGTVGTPTSYPTVPVDDTSPVRARARGATARTPDGWPPPECKDPEAHDAAKQHRFHGGGVGWRCVVCSRDPEGSLKERVGWNDPLERRPF